MYIYQYLLNYIEFTETTHLPSLIITNFYIVLILLVTLLRTFHTLTLNPHSSSILLILLFLSSISRQRTRGTDMLIVQNHANPTMEVCLQSPCLVPLCSDASPHYTNRRERKVITYGQNMFLGFHHTTGYMKSH